MRFGNTGSYFAINFQLQMKKGENSVTSTSVVLHFINLIDSDISQNC